MLPPEGDQIAILGINDNLPRTAVRSSSSAMHSEELMRTTPGSKWFIWWISIWISVENVEKPRLVFPSLMMASWLILIWFSKQTS